VGLPRADVSKLEADFFQEAARVRPQDAAGIGGPGQRPATAAEAKVGPMRRPEQAVVEPIPNINVLGGRRWQVGTPPMDQGLMQVMIEVPLSDRNQGNIRSARADIASARADLRSIELDLATQAAQAIAAYRTSQRLVDWYTNTSSRRRETVQITQTLYGRGEVTFLEPAAAQAHLHRKRNWPSSKPRPTAGPAPSRSPTSSSWKSSRPPPLHRPPAKTTNCSDAIAWASIPTSPHRPRSKCRRPRKGSPLPAP